MKRILPLFCLALIGAPLSVVVMPVPVQAAEFKVDLKLADIIRIAADQDHKKKRDRDNNDQQDDNNRRYDNRRVEDTGRNNRQQQGGGERNDNGMSRAYGLAAEHGRVIDVWALGGPMFGASVSNNRGKIELLINVNSRQVDERN